MMSTGPSMEDLAQALRKIYVQHPDRPEEAMEAFLSRELADLDPSERIRVLDRIQGVFSPGAREADEGPAAGSDSDLVSLLLGIRIPGGDVGAAEVVSRLGESLNTIFTTLNDLIRLIDMTLGGTGVGEETIRHIIGSSLEDQGKVQSIEAYLGRIRQAFLTAQQSSKEAARTIAGYILTEFDPAAMESSIKGFKLGPMKKAEAFEIFEEKYRRVRKWYDSERFMLDFLRQFEKNCQKSFT